MKKFTEDYLSEEVQDVVITCPANFTDAQRSAVINAGKIAGLNDMRLINEPTAACIAYDFQNRDRQIPRGGENVLVFDFGGGTLDCSLMKI